MAQDGRATADDLAADRALAGNASRGDAAAARALYDAHVARIHRLVYRLSGDADRAQDLTQETFIRAFGRLAQYRGEVPLGAWLRAIALSVTFNGLRSDRRRRGREVPLFEHAASGEGGAERALVRARLTEAVDALPEIYRAVVVMHDVEGYTHVEIGETLGIPAGTSRARLTYARAQLRELMTGGDKGRRDDAPGS